MYQNAKYHQIWINNLKAYLEDSQYFDLVLYFKAVILFEKEKQYLAKAFLKLYNNESRDQIDYFLKKYKSKYDFTKVKAIYDSLSISSAKIIPRYLDENKIESFLEQLVLDENIDNERFLWHFSINFEEMKARFNDTYTIFSEIVRNYLKNISQKDKKIIDFVNLSSNREIKLNIDSEIRNYFKYKNIFYKNIIEILKTKNNVER